MNFKKLKGLTIQDVIVEEHTIYDDDPTIVLWCNNGRKYRIEGGYEEGTDESAGEMRSKLTLSSVNVKREPEFRVDELEEVVLVSKKKGNIVIDVKNIMGLSRSTKEKVIRDIMELL